MSFFNRFSNNDLPFVTTPVATGAIRAYQVTVNSHSFTIPLTHAESTREHINYHVETHKGIHLKLSGSDVWLVNTHTITMHSV